MAMSLIGSPDYFGPAYNPNLWYFNSTNKNNPGFRYIVQVYDINNTTLLGTFRIAPAPSTGYGIFDITRFIRNFVSFQTIFSGTIWRVPNDWFCYVLRVGEEYNDPFVFDDTVFYSGGLTNCTSNVTGDTHTFVVGDAVQVHQTTVQIPALEGYCTVVAVPSATEVVVDVPFLSTPVNPGEMIFADGRKTQTLNIYTSDVTCVFNGAFAFDEFPNFDPTDYTFDQTTGDLKFLTDCPDNFLVYETQDVVFHYANYFTNNGNTVVFETSDGNVFASNTFANQNSQVLLGVSVGPNSNPSFVSGPGGPFIQATTEWYDVYITDGSTQFSEKRRFYIDRRCRIMDYELLFLDRLGSWGSFAMELRANEFMNANKSEFQKLAGGFDGVGYGYNLSDRGATIYNVDMEQTITLNTNWMDDDHSVYFEQLKSSPEVYLKKTNDKPLKYRAVVVTQFTPETERLRNKRLVKYTVTLKYANSDVVNI